MKLTIFAATGGIGRQLLEQAVAAGHDVTAVVRNPGKLSRQVRTVTADLTGPDPAALESAVAGADAVLSGLGPRSNADAGVASQGTRAIVTAMQATGTRRVVVVSAAPVSTTPSPGRPNPPKHDPGDGFFMRHLGAPVTKAALRKTYADLALMEEILRGSGLDWTVIRPPRLTGKPLTGSYRTAFGQNLRRGLFISRAPTSPTSCSACSSSPKRSIGLSESQIDQEERTVTAKDTADRAAEAIDFTMMYATHDAFRRDLGRLTAASAAGTADAPGVRAGWENFKAQLLLHHSVEDSDLWPRVRRAAAGRPSSLALLDEMEAEHARIDPLLAAVDAALANPAGNLAAHVAALTSALGRHLKHEEDAALPLIQAVCTSADWRAFTGEMRRRQGLKGAAIYVPWILDGAAPAGRQRFLAALPAPVRVINRLVLEPRFRQRGLWKA